MRLVLIIVTPFAFGCMFLGPKFFLNVTFRGLGVRTEGVSLELPLSEMNALSRASDVLRRPIIDCRKVVGDKLLVHGANVLWNGIGELTLVEFVNPAPPRTQWFATEPKPLQKVEMRVDSKTARVLKTVPKIDPCYELPTDFLFSTGKFDLAASATANFSSIAANIKQAGSVAKLHVRGHSDARPAAGSWENKKLDNQLLSEKRAEAVAMRLKALLSLSDDQISWDGAGARELKTQCPSDKKTTDYEKEQCNRPNRRVELRVNFVAVKPKEETRKEP